MKGCLKNMKRWIGVDIIPLAVMNKFSSQAKICYLHDNIFFTFDRNLDSKLVEYINVNELLTGQTALPVPETVEDAAPLSHSFQFFC